MDPRQGSASGRRRLPTWTLKTRLIDSNGSSIRRSRRSSKGRKPRCVIAFVPCIEKACAFRFRSHSTHASLFDAGVHDGIFVQLRNDIIVDGRFFTRELRFQIASSAAASSMGSSVTTCHCNTSCCRGLPHFHSHDMLTRVRPCAKAACGHASRHRPTASAADAKILRSASPRRSDC